MKKHGHGYWTVIIFDVRFIASTSHWLWSFYLFLFTVSLLAIRLPCFNKFELSWAFRLLLWKWSYMTMYVDSKSYALSVRDFVEVTREVTIKHYRIHKLPDNTVFIARRSTFHDLLELVEHYQGMPAYYQSAMYLPTNTVRGYRWRI